MRILKYTLWVVLFFYIAIVFLPKENFYFFAEHKLERQISFSNESIKDSFGILKISDALISYYGDDAGRVDKITILPFILYNEVNVENLHLAEKFNKIIPVKIDKASFKTTLFYPIKIWISLSGDFGDISGNYNIYGKTIRLVLKPQENFKQRYPFIYKEFKDIDGELVYESSFK
ncbi:MAG: hypothetical protein LBS39_04045 [Campylobacteraceae bacterium]|jgi:hypothetical protein|nr:hypothetical protein [Campylobacteraceae bacterium]